MRFDCGVYWNNAVHWISTLENSLYFDLCEEKLHELPMPRVPYGLEERRVEYFGNCGGNLHLIEVYEAEMELNVYQMQDNHSGWFVKYRVDLRGVSVGFPEMIPSVMDVDMGFFPKFSVAAIVEGIDQEAYVVLEVEGKIVRVNVESGRFERLGQIENDGRTSEVPITVGFGRIDAFLYIENLACV